MALLSPIHVVVHGGAKGADVMADKACHEVGVHTACVRALWAIHDKSAGHIRNAVMLDAFQPSLVIAFSENTPGTRGCIAMAEERNIEVEVHYR